MLPTCYMPFGSSPYPGPQREGVQRATSHSRCALYQGTSATPRECTHEKPGCGRGLSAS